MTRIRLENVTKVFGKTVAVDNVNLDIRDGEFFTIIGPSGCGKTTTLRIIAGFEVPEHGHVYFDDKDVTFLKPYHRNTAMVFQNYALWPHMTVYENIAYGLRLRKVPEEEIRRKIKYFLKLVGMEGLENRYPLQLSGGQQQRVALIRALVVEPSVLLLDEPLSNLDAKLRLEMREEIRGLQKRLNITTVYVTHDQIEALSMSDRIAVMNRGKVLQVGEPNELYFKPGNLFVASFLGRSNILEGKLAGEEPGNIYLVDVPTLGTTLRVYSAKKIEAGRVYLVIRPESFEYGSKPAPSNSLRGRVENIMFLGDKYEVKLRIGEEDIVAYLPNKYSVEPGSTIELSVDPDRIAILTG